MLPRASNASSSFRHFEELRDAIEQLQPMKSDQQMLIALGIDPVSLPNTTVFTYADLLRRFTPGTVAFKEDLDPGIVACLAARDGCRGWELNVGVISTERTGISWPISLISSVEQ